MKWQAEVSLGQYKAPQLVVVEAPTAAAAKTKLESQYGRGSVIAIRPHK